MKITEHRESEIMAAAVGMYDQSGGQAVVRRAGTDCGGCDKSCGSGAPGRAELAETRATEQRSGFESNTVTLQRVFSVRLAARIESLAPHRPVAANATAYDTEDTLAPQLLRNVASYLKSAISQEQAQSIVARARAAVSETIQELRGLPLWGAGLGSAQRSMLDSLQAGLNRLEEQVPSQLQFSETEMSYSLRSKLSLEVKTQDGDVVRLKLRATHRESFAGKSYLGADESAIAVQSYTATDMRLRVEIEGELDAAELTAIEDVIAQVDAVAQGLTGGDFDTAVDALMSFTMDGEELASVNARMRVREQMQFAANELYAQEPPPVLTQPVESVTTERPKQAVAPAEPAPVSPVEVPPHVVDPVAATAAAPIVAEEPATASLARLLHEFISANDTRIKLTSADGDFRFRLKIDERFVADLLNSLIDIRRH